jgi:hypothetical protein
MNETHTQNRPVSDFNQVSIRGNTCSAQLILTQGEYEGLMIEAPPEYLHRIHSDVKNRKLTIRLEGSWLQELEDAISSCLNKPHIVYRLTVRELTYLAVQCAYSVHLSGLETPHLQVKLNGTGDFRLDWLSAETLEVHHSGSGAMEVSGHVEEQNVTLNGVGSYIAPSLESQHARVRIMGAGTARVHAIQTLDIGLRGVGILEYCGNPAVSRQISGPGQVLHTEKSPPGYRA